MHERARNATREESDTISHLSHRYFPPVKKSKINKKIQVDLRERKEDGKGLTRLPCVLLFSVLFSFSSSKNSDLLSTQENPVPVFCGLIIGPKGIAQSTISALSSGSALNQK